MLNSSQIETVSGIVCNYKDYVVYYAGDYPRETLLASYGEDDPDEATEATQPSDDLILIFCGSGFTNDGTTFYFGDDVACYRLTYNKYIDAVPAPGIFNVPASELVYTNLASDYPDLTFWESKFNNTDFNVWIILFCVIPLSLDVIFHVIFGGKK